MEYRHELVCGAVVEKVTCEGEVTSPNLVGHVVRKKCRNLRLQRIGRVAGQWGFPQIKIISVCCITRKQKPR